MRTRHEIKCHMLFDFIRKDYRDNGRKSETSLINTLKHLEPFFSERSAARVTTGIVEEYKDERRKDGTAPATVNLELAILRRCFNLGMHKEVIATKPRITLFHLNNARQGFFEPREYRAMLDALPENFKNILRFGYLSGWRKSEILGLRWDKNYNGETIRIYDSKNRDGRVLPLHGELSEVIQQQLARKVSDCELVFHNQGKKWTNQTFYNRWDSACKITGVNKRFHDLRRTAVRNLTRAGVHRAIAKKITGHKTDSVFERYDIVDEQDIISSMERVQSYLAKNRAAEQQKNMVINEPAITSQNGSKPEMDCRKEGGDVCKENPISNLPTDSKPANLIHKFIAWFKTRA